MKKRPGFDRVVATVCVLALALFLPVHAALPPTARELKENERSFLPGYLRDEDLPDGIALVPLGYDFGQSRVICGVHWQSDVDAGRLIGAAVVARLHADPVFRVQLDEAKRELAAARRKRP